MWGDKPEHKVLALRERLNTLSRAEREALCQELMRPNVANSIEVLAPTSGKELLDLLVQTPGAGDVLGELIGGRCGGSCRTDLNLGCYNRRLSIFEEERLRANLGGAIDIPPVAGAGGTEVVTIPAYNVEWYLREFSMDGQIALATGSLNRVNVQITHAGIVLAEFRVSQYYKESCCTTIVEQFRRHKLCLGWASTLTITVTNGNALAGETFINGVFSYARGYPDPITGF